MKDEAFKVFILEDMPEDMALNKRQVRKYNPSVLFASATNRVEFEAKLVDFQPDLVLSDYNLPDMNGLEALLYVREHLDATPFIFITGILNDEEKVADTILNGASGYLLKENIKNLPELLAAVMEKHQGVLAQKEKEWERRRNNQLLLQKGIAALRNGELNDLETLIRDLQEVSDNLP
ncbi:response regulator [Neolewinella lacunae]|uniref:Response regulator n=1 Tax=Neolewinella lacunae TaxID=1517758 RepID=A0A923T8W9_9BACT|nr:response regulator [Neolewinella lacunae]MBC6994423.1 response regulator [Neolewinella lacunae]MDN3633359.1 response regulator [Neolewinella lacunae]